MGQRISGQTRLIAIFLALAAILTAGVRAQAIAAQGDHDAFRYFAARILEGIGSAKFNDIPAIGGYGRPRIAVLPFSSDETGVSPTVASELNSRLLAELTRQGSRSYRFVAREALKSIIREIDTIGELDPGNDGRVKDLLRNARVDILIVGRLRHEGAGYVLSYEAVSVEDGTLFAATGPRQVSGAERAGVSPTVPMRVREALRQVAWRFARELGEETLVSIAAIGEAPDGKATPKGDYLTELLADSLRFRLHRPGKAGARVRIDKDGSGPPRRHHARVKGRYWDLGEVLEVRLVLHRAGGIAIPWRQLVSTEGLPGPAPYAAPPRVGAAPPPRIEPDPWPATPLPGPDPRPRPMVRDAQRLLAGLGYDPGPADGVLRRQTRAALRAFQRDHGLDDHGRLTRETMRRLRRSWRRAEIAL